MQDHPVDQRPWERLEEIADSGEQASLAEYCDEIGPAEVSRAMAHMDVEHQNQVLSTLSPDDAADLVDELPDAQALDLMRHVDPDTAAAIVHELPSDAQADLVAHLSADEQDSLLLRLEPAEAAEIRALASYDDGTAGGLMVTEYVRFPHDATTDDIVTDLQTNAAAYAEFDVQYIYIVDDAGGLAGVVRLRDLVLSRPATPASRIMIRDVASVQVDADLDQLTDLFERHAYLAFPVTGADGQLLGVLRRSGVEEAMRKRADSYHLKSAGIVGGEELRTMPTLTRSRRRLAWLSINVVLNVVAASVIAMYEETLSSVIALAFFLPIISDMSGCSGNQAVAVSIRELTIGIVKPHEMMYVWLKEIVVGLINGLVLGALIGVVAYLWRGNAWLGLVIGAALAANTLVAVSVGGLIPLVLKRFHLDPALASGPVLTTVTDICGFLFALGFATAVLSKLVGA